MGGKMSRRKGYRAENLLVQLLKPYTEVMRVPLSGGSTIKGDVLVGSGDSMFRIEVKNQEAISDKLWQWIEGNEGLVLKKNNRPFLLLVNLEELLK